MFRIDSSLDDCLQPFRESGACLSDVDTASAKLPRREHYSRLRWDFAALVDEALNYSNARMVDKRAVRQATGLTHHQRPRGALMSHQGVRSQAGRALHRQLKTVFAPTATRRWYFVTLLTDLGNSLEFSPVLELGRLKHRGWKMLDLVGLHFIGVTELQLSRYPLGGVGRTIEGHLHVIGYTDDPLFVVSEAVVAIAARSTLSNWLGADVANFQPITTLHELNHWCDYMFKAPLQGNWLRSDKFMRSGFSTQSGNVNKWGALRLVDVQSQLTLNQATFARGNLVKPKNDWLRHMAAWVAKYPARQEYDYQAAFAAVWSGSTVKRLRTTPIIQRTASKQLNLTWNDAMQRYFDKVASNQARYDSTAALRQLGSTGVVDDL